MIPTLPHPDTAGAARGLPSRPPRATPRLATLAALGLLAALVGLTACEGTPLDAPVETLDAPASPTLRAVSHDHLAHAAARGGPPASMGHAPDLARMRAGTAHYQRFDRAVADGFVDPSGELECVAHPELGGMGIHFVNFERYATLEIDPSRPEILLYEPRSGGGMKLVGVEFAVNAEAWYAAGNTAPPSVAGVPYDPPNPAAGNPLVQSSYTLHVWTWQHNPEGMFRPFNPRVSCP
jgi:hypothetical protein